MGGAQPLAGRMAGAIILCVEIDEERIGRRLANGFLDQRAPDLDAALAMIDLAKREGRATSIALLGNAADVCETLLARGVVPDVVTDQTSAHDLLYGYVPSGRSLAEVRHMREHDPQRLIQENRATIARHVRAMLGFKRVGAIVFDNGNLIRTQAHEAGVADAFDIQIFTEAYLRPLFARAIGPFRWISLVNDRDDIREIDEHLLVAFPHNRILANWVGLARRYVPFEGLPARIAWLGHGERTALALAVNRMVREGTLSGPIAFTRDHLDAGAMAHPNIMTEHMRDGSDAIADWPLLDAMAMCSSQADLVAIHSGGGGYSGYMTSAGVTVIADGTGEADERLRLSLTNDTSLGVMRYADAGYPEALDEAASKGVRHFQLP
jgi:urocanate hydratase